MFVREMTESGTLKKIRKEDGCLRYDYYYSAQDPNALLLIEEWTSREHQKVHLAQSHMAFVRECKDRFIESVKLGSFCLGEL